MIFKDYEFTNSTFDPQAIRSYDLESLIIGHNLIQSGPATVCLKGTQFGSKVFSSSKTKFLALDPMEKSAKLNVMASSVLLKSYMKLSLIQLHV